MARWQSHIKNTETTEPKISAYSSAVFGSCSQEYMKQRTDLELLLTYNCNIKLNISITGESQSVRHNVGTACISPSSSIQLDFYIFILRWPSTVVSYSIQLMCLASQYNLLTHWIS